MFTDPLPSNLETPLEASLSYSGEGLTIEAQLLADATEARRTEIERYGRAEIFNRITSYLQGDVRVAFALVNHIPAVLDDYLDAGGGQDSLLVARRILRESFDGKHPEVLVVESWNEGVIHLGKTLAQLHRNKFDGANKVLNEIDNFWAIEVKNLDRRNRVLSAQELEELTQSIGKSVSLQFLHLLVPELDDSEKETLAERYGLAIKLADNFSDLVEDLGEGFINISEEDIRTYDLEGDVVPVYKILNYLGSELQKIDTKYNEGDEYLNELVSENPKSVQGLSLFRELASTWLNQAHDSYSPLSVAE